MKKVLLTSTGFNNVNIKNKFLELLDTDIDTTKVLFIITAAIDCDSIRILSSCLDDLTSCGIKEDNIIIYDMHKKINLNTYDAIYVCGGDTDTLENRIEELDMQQSFIEYVENGGIYIGVSAGSIVASGNYINGMKLLNNILDVHCRKGSTNGLIYNNNDINLTDNQAIYINDNDIIIFE